MTTMPAPSPQRASNATSVSGAVDVRGDSSSDGADTAPDEPALAVPGAAWAKARPWLLLAPILVFLTVLAAAALVVLRMSFGTQGSERCEVIDPAEGERAQLEALRRQAESFAEFAAGRLGVEAPICDAVSAILAGETAVDPAIAALLARPLRAES